MTRLSVSRTPPATRPGLRARRVGAERVYASTMTDETLPAVLVLGRDTCEDTIRSKALLAQRGIPFSYLKVDEDPAADAWIRRLNDGRWRTPTILIGAPDAPDAILREPSDQELLAALGFSA